MPRSRCAQAALLIGAALFALSAQQRFASALITVTSDGATRIAPHFQPKDPWADDDDDDDDSEEGSAPSHQTWERTWTVASHTALLDDNDEIDEVKLSVPGRVFLSTSTDQAPLAKVRFSGDSADVLNFFEVVSTARGVLEIRARSGMATISLKGYLLVEVTLAHLQKLKTVSTGGSADVIIENDVLVAYSPSDSVSITTRGSGNVYIHDAPSFNVQTLALSTTGSGDIELSTSQIAAQKLSGETHGSGDLRLFVNSVVVKETTLSTAGSGDTYLNSYNFNSDSVVVSIAGSGDVSVYPSGRCTTEKISLAGSGDAYVGSIACVQATVNIAGSGDAIVQASESISGGIMGSGDIQYVGQAPVTIAPLTSRSSSSKKAPKPMAEPAGFNKFEEAKLRDLPQCKPVHLSHNFEDFGLGFGATNTTVLVPLVIVALFAAWYIRHENKKLNTRENAQEMQPLRSTQAQVYV